MECQVIQQAVFINKVKNQPWPQHIDNDLEIPFDQSLARATLTCQLPQSNISMAMSGSNHQLSIPHQLYAMMHRRGSPNVQGPTTNNNYQANGKHQRGDQNDGNNQNENGNTNCRDERNNDNRRPPINNNRNNRPIGGIISESRQTTLKELGFLKAGNRYVTFVHKFSGHDNKGICNYFAYKRAVCKETDSGTCNFAYITSFQRLPACDKNALTAWVQDKPGVSFVQGRRPITTG